MRVLLSFLFFLFALTGAAQAKCAGKDLFADLQRTDPAMAETLLRRAGAVPYGEGRFWKIEKPGVRPSYLYGTFHVGEAVELVPESAWAALDGARIALFETKQDAQAELRRRMTRDRAFMIDQDARPFSDRMGPDDLNMVRKAFRSRGVALETAERFKSWLQIGLLALPPCQILHASADAALDGVMARRAAEKGVPEDGLEEPGDALAALTRLPEDMVTKLIVASGRAAPYEEDVFRTNLALYAAGKIALIKVYSDWLAETTSPDLQLPRALEKMYASILVRRNRAWMPRVLNEAAKGNAFIAVGALHLGGGTGLIAGLVRDGFTAHRMD